MLKLNKVYLLSNLSSLPDLLENNEYEGLSGCYGLYEDKFAVQYILKNNLYTIRIWKTKVLFNYWYNDFDYSGKNLIATLDYYPFDTYIKIKNLFINDGTIQINNLYNFLLDANESEDLVNTLIHYIKKIAIVFNKKKIIMDVHENCKNYEKYYYYLGFELTKRRSKANIFWLESELTL